MRARAALLALAVAGAVSAPAGAGIPPVPIPQGNEPARRFVGAPARPRPLDAHRRAAARIPRHPFMAANGRSNIHDDAYMSDAYVGSGPLGRGTVVRSTFHVAECASLTFDRRGRIVTICVGPEGPRLVLVRPRTLRTEAVLPLPPRQVQPGTSPFSDFSGGGYFYLDHRDRAVVPTNTREIWVVGIARTPAGPAFEVVRRHDVSSAVPPGDAIVSVLPDWDGRLWFVTTGGRVGTVSGGRVRRVHLQAEGIFNSFATDETGGVFVVSDHALYRFDADRNGRPRVTWRRSYDRGSRHKPGQVSWGSGTTPTLLGRRYVAITDNADPRMRVLVYRRGRRAGDAPPVCRRPVFAARRGATDNSLIGVGRSLVVENNYGYSGPLATMDGAATEPGLARVDLDGRGCRVVWNSRERAPSVVPKLSVETGLVYTYTNEPDPQGDADPWYLTAIDFRTGRTVWKRLAGRDLGFNNNWAPISLGPDGTAYVGALGGLVSFRDR